MKKAWFLKSLVILLLLILTIASTSACISQPEVESRAWIDFPLEGSEFGVGKPIQIISHFYAKEGVNICSISINGKEIIKEPPPKSGETFVEFSQEWVPDLPGQHTIEVAVYGADNVALSKAQINVNIVGKIASSPAEEEPAEELPAEEPPAEESPVEEPPVEEPPPAEEPPPEEPPPEEPPDTTPPTISNMQASQDPIVEEPCQPDSVTISASVSDASGISQVKLYYRIVKGAQNGAWQTPAMTTTGGGKYQLTVGPGQFKSSLNPYGGSILQIYVKAWDSKGNTAQTGSSNVYIQVCVL